MIYFGFISDISWEGFEEVVVFLFGFYFLVLGVFGLGFFCFVVDGFFLIVWGS